MRWANDQIKFEKKWYDAVKKEHKRIMDVVANFLGDLSVNQDGVYDKKDKPLLVPKDTEKVMEAIGKKLIKETMIFFGNKAVAEIRSGVYKVRGKGQVSVDLFNPNVQDVQDYIDTHAYEFAGEVNSSLLQTLRDQWNGYLETDIENRSTVHELIQRVEQIFQGETREEWSRARRIARTESVGAANMAAEFAYEQEDVPGKRWLTSRDKLVRDSHQDMEGVTVKTSEKFTVGKKKMKGPGDPKGGPEEICYCRCTLIPVFALQEG